MKTKQKNQPIKISQVLVVRSERLNPVDIQDCTNAITQAFRGRRARLTELYNNLLLDGVLFEAMDKRIRAITNAELVFQKDGKTSDAIWDFMDTPEFEKLLREIMLSRFYGKSVVELDFSQGFKVQSIDRRHLDTEKQLILRQQGDSEGISYLDDDFLLNIGDDKDLGLFARTAPYAIFKRNGGADYAQFCELFGIPQLVGRYDPEDENGREEMENAFKARGSAGSMVMSNKSNIETINTDKTNAAVHKDFLDHWDKQILIAIQGQTMTTTDGTSLAQAKVHGETEDDLQKADRIFVRRFLNHELKPRLEKRGFPVKGGFFNFVENAKPETLLQKLDIAQRVHQLTQSGIDEDYFYEEFGLPKSQKKDAESQTQEARRETQDRQSKNKDKTKDETILSRPRVVRKPIRSTNLFQRFFDFFAHAPR